MWVAACRTPDALCAGQEAIYTKPRIFVGSSSEAAWLARRVGAAIERADRVAVIWDTSAFPVGSTLLERIESLADEVEGAILLFTPDVHASRAGKTTEEAVSNVMFEYGYLSARLGRQRVAICLVDGAALPSDLHGVKVIQAGTMGYRPSAADGAKEWTPDLPDQLIGELRSWLEALPHRAECIPPVVQLHGYSGTWDIETRFEVFRGLQVTPPDEVFWFGFVLLLIPPSGRGGKGIMYGSNHVNWRGYRTQHDVVNEVRDATVDERGVLTLRVLILRRQLVRAEGKLPDDRLNTDLPAKDFYIRLEPVAGQARELRGVHEYTRGVEPFQRATERYRHIE
jgi:hypothetical protein